jgi:hypothetical protein
MKPRIYTVLRMKNYAKILVSEKEILAYLNINRKKDFTRAKEDDKSLTEINQIFSIKKGL